VVDCDGVGVELALPDRVGLGLPEVLALGLLEAVLFPPLAPVLCAVPCWPPGALVPPAEPLARAVAGGAATDPGRV
jgi:hypothetical protein